MTPRVRDLPVAIFFVLVTVLALHRIYDPDLWLHLAAGEHITRTGTIPRENLFSLTHPHQPWLDVYWLYQVGLVTLWNLAGSAGVMLLRVSLSLGLAAIVALGFRDRHQPLTGVGTAVLLLAWLVITPRLTDRPELLSYVLLGGLLVLIRARRWWWWLPLQVIWANVQGLFYLGPVLLALAAICERLEGRSSSARSAGWAALAAGLACAVSPFGWRNLTLAADFLHTVRALGDTVEELASPFHPAVWSASGNSQLFVIWLAVVALVIGRGRKLPPRFDCIILLSSVIFACLAQRAIPVAVLCALPVVLANGWSLPARTETCLRWGTIALMMVVAGGFVAGARPLRPSARIERVFGIGPLAARFPEQAAAHLPEQARVGNAHFHTGGFLLWMAQGRRPVLIDGRLEAYPREFVTEYDHSLRDPDRYRQFAKRHNLTHTFVAKDSAAMIQFAERLAAAPGWQRVYADDLAEVFEHQ